MSGRSQLPVGGGGTGCAAVFLALADDRDCVSSDAAANRLVSFNESPQVYFCGHKEEDEEELDISSEGVNQNSIPSLLTLCRVAAVSKLESFPTGAFGILDSDEFLLLLRLRHERTTPKNGFGGLDGKGRLKPAVMPKFLAPIEEAFPHLANSDEIDTLIWRDCVEHRFRRSTTNTSVRPRTLLLPYPVLLQQVLTLKEQVESLHNDIASGSVWSSSIDPLCRETPMSVPLLQESGIGKAVKSVIKRLQAESSAAKLGIVDDLCCHLEALLRAWRDVATISGIASDPNTPSLVTADSRSTQGAAPPESARLAALRQEAIELRELQRHGRSWRELYRLLEKREERQRNSQGQRMREIRKNLAVGRPKIVKVRPTPRYDRILDGKQSSNSSSMQKPGGAMVASANKIQKIRLEAQIVISRQRPTGTSPATSPTPSRSSTLVSFTSASSRASSFGSSVAFATARPKKRKSLFHDNPRTRKAPPPREVVLDGAKRMKIPAPKTPSAVGFRLQPQPARTNAPALLAQKLHSSLNPNAKYSRPPR
jgi:hypothetical protein